MAQWEKLEPYLRRICDLDGITEEHLDRVLRRTGLAARGVSSGEPELAVVAEFSTSTTSSRLAAESSVAGSSEPVLDSWRRFRRGQSLSEGDKARIEAIVLPNGLRPAFDVSDDTFEDLPDPWQSFNAHRSYINSCIRAIGRVNVPGHARLQYAGTAFIVGAGLLLTNRHVADEFCETGGAKLVFTSGISPSIDMKQEVGNSSSVEVKIAEAVLILNDWDGALLRLAQMPAQLKPLSLAGSSPVGSNGRLAGIVGYPALDTRGSTEEVLQQIQIFRAIFNKKRLQPGRLLGQRQTTSFGQQVDALAHDCSTLGGNSGSAVIDVEAETILGLHFGGEYLIANYAVPSWKLAEDRRLHAQGVLFA
jgi:endonuclease G